MSKRKKPKYTSGHYLLMPSQLYAVAMQELSAVQFTTLSAITYSTAGYKQDENWLSYRRLAEMTGLSRRALFDAVAHLEGKGWIKRKYRCAKCKQQKGQANHRCKECGSKERSDIVYRLHMTKQSRQKWHEHWTPAKGGAGDALGQEPKGAESEYISGSTEPVIARGSAKGSAGDAVQVVQEMHPITLSNHYKTDDGGVVKTPPLHHCLDSKAPGSPVDEGISWERFKELWQGFWERHVTWCQSNDRAIPEGEDYKQKVRVHASRERYLGEIDWEEVGG